MNQEMQKIFEQAQQLVNGVQSIADALFLHNPGHCNQYKMPLNTIACDIATLMRDYSILRTDINKKVREF